MNYNAHIMRSIRRELEEQAKKRIDGGWISAGTPPDDNHDVWVSYKPIQKSHPNNKDRPRRYCVGYYSKVLQRWFVTDANRFPSCICEVTHWQEIIPPNEEDMTTSVTHE